MTALCPQAGNSFSFAFAPFVANSAGRYIAQHVQGVMMSSISPSLPENFWRKMVWAIVLDFALWLVPALLVMVVFHKSAVEMAGPYLAFAVPVPIFVLFASWLRILEDRGLSPRQLALAWSLMTMLFASVIGVATVYSATQLHFIEPEDVLAFVVAGVLVALIPPFTIYRRMLNVTAARAAKRSDDTRAN